MHCIKNSKIARNSIGGDSRDSQNSLFLSRPVPKAEERSLRGMYRPLGLLMPLETALQLWVQGGKGSRGGRADKICSVPLSPCSGLRIFPIFIMVGGQPAGGCFTFLFFSLWGSISGTPIPVPRTRTLWLSSSEARPIPSRIPHADLNASTKAICFVWPVSFFSPARSSTFGEGLITYLVLVPCE